MESESNANNFEIFMLESVEGNSTGTGFRLKEMFDQNLGDHYKISNLKFRKMD